MSRRELSLWCMCDIVLSFSSLVVVVVLYQLAYMYKVYKLDPEVEASLVTLVLAIRRAFSAVEKLTSCQWKMRAPAGDSDEKGDSDDDASYGHGTSTCHWHE